MENRREKAGFMKICIVGLGVIGTTYGYVFQKAGHQVEHLLREEKKSKAPTSLNISLLDGRYNKKGEEKRDRYRVNLAKPNTEYDFIILSVASGKIKDAVATLSQNHIRGSLILFCNFWNSWEEMNEIAGAYPYIIGFPTAGGRLLQNNLECVLFDHIMLESEEKAGISNYKALKALLESVDLKTEIPYDMVEWIWIHMAINAGVTSSAAREGKIDSPAQLALNLMQDAHALSITVKAIRETIQVVKARGVDLSFYKNELLPYRIPSAFAGILMKRMFKTNELTRRIMTLHSDVGDMLYGCKCVYETGKLKHIELPVFYSNMDKLFIIADSQLL